MENVAAIEERLRKSPLYCYLCEMAENDPDVKSLCSIVHDAVDYSINRAKLVIRHLDEFTLHDDAHLFRVLYHMGLLIPAETQQKLKPLELALLILSAFFHDIGMAPSERYVKLYKGKEDRENLDEQDKSRLEEFQLFCKSKPRIQEKINFAYEQKDYGHATTLENYRVTEFIRVTHAKRVKDIIIEIESNEKWAKGFVYKNFAFGNYLSKICESHNESLMDNTNSLIATSIPVANDEYMNSTFICIILRLADLLDFDAKRTPSVLYEHLGIRNEVSIKEWQKHRAIQSWEINPNTIRFSAECEHPVIEKSIKTFCDYIDQELYQCRLILENMNDRIRPDLKEIYKLPLAYKVDTSLIRAKLDYEGKPLYQYKDISFTLDQDQIVNLLMGTSLYASSSVAIREMLQNSIDACNVRGKLEEKWEQHYSPYIRIEFLNKNGKQYLQFEDNGLGMDELVVTQYFSKVGCSFYRSEDFYREMAKYDIEYKPISKFGIGIISLFMISSGIEVETRKVLGNYDYSSPLNIKVESLSGFFTIKSGSRKEPGTKITLELKKGHDIPTNTNDLKRLIENFINYIDIPVSVNGAEVATRRSDNQLAQWRSASFKQVKFYPINMNTDEGIEGMVVVALLEEDGEFTDDIQIDSREVEIDGEFVDMEERIRTTINAIEHVTDSYDVDGGVEQGFSSHLATMGQLYLNGIAVSDTLFHNSNRLYRNNDNNKIGLPFPLYYNINLTGDLLLHTNAARDRIIEDDTWNSFKRKFIRLLLKLLLDQVHTKKKIKSFAQVLDLNYSSVYSKLCQEIIELRLKEIT